jgi:N-glycosylase/DNA lyase
MSDGAPPRKSPRVSVEVTDFDLATTLECGQVFGWTTRGDTYLGLIGGRAVSLRQAGGCLETVTEGRMSSARRAEIERYLGLDDDLGAIRRSIAVDPFMKGVLARVHGLRLLKQEPWPCLCSYLLSSSNRVERIDKSVKEIARRWGKRHVLGGQDVYELPAPSRLGRCGTEGMRSCGAGFRAPYLVRAAERVASGDLDLKRVARLPYEDAKQELIRLDGVGEKIADCVLLFAFQRHEAFPVDVWIKKAVERIYFDSQTVSAKEIRRFAAEHFGPYAGYAQEYIYYYARTLGLALP